MTNPKPAGEKSADPAENAPALETEARGFALYVGVDEATAAAAGVSLSELVTALRKTVADLVPSAAAETYAAVALAPKGSGAPPHTSAADDEEDHSASLWSVALAVWIGALAVALLVE